MEFHPEMTSPHTKSPLISSDLRADAQCFKIAMLLLHGAKHSSLALHSRLPEGRKPRVLQDYSGTGDFRVHGSKNLFHRAILYGHKKILLSRKIAGKIRVKLCVIF